MSLIKLKVRNPLHYVVGIIVVLSYWLHPVLSVLGFLSFMLYQFDEDWHLKDGAFRDILEFNIGFFITCVGLIIKEVFL